MILLLVSPSPEASMKTKDTGVPEKGTMHPSGLKDAYKKPFFFNTVNQSRSIIPEVCWVAGRLMRTVIAQHQTSNICKLHIKKRD